MIALVLLGLYFLLCFLVFSNVRSVPTPGRSMGLDMRACMVSPVLYAASTPPPPSHCGMQMLNANPYHKGTRLQSNQFRT